MREFYVSAEGDDQNNGTSPSSPWRSLQKVNSTIFLPGDRIRLRCGDTFYGAVNIRTANATPSAPCVLGAYGGDIRRLPIISCYKVIKPGAWDNVSGSIWRTNINDTQSVQGNIWTTGASGANIGSLKVGNNFYTNKRNSLEELASDWDFFSDSQSFLYVRSRQHPADQGGKILAAPQTVAIGGAGNMQYQHLEIVGSGGHGARWAGKSGIDMEFCHLHEIGGSGHAGAQRYGNGVEIWVDCSNINVSNCLIGDVYDAATTIQGYPVATPGSGWSNIRLDDNFAYRCAQAFEVWARFGAKPGAGACPEGSGFHAVTALRWNLFDIGYGSFADRRSSRSEVAPFLIYGVETPVVDIQVSVAQMRNCGDRLIAAPRLSRLPGGYRLDDSRLTLRPNQQLDTVSGMTTKSHRAWLQAKGFSPETTLTIEANPKITDRETVKNLWMSHVVAL